ncbi:DNA translocase FtsK [Sphingobacterium faecium]|uniref:DNA translocase FtsK n=1 Tax=Sphingobacterium faecium TaxID=34087 RepID=UPI00320AF5CC
MKDEARLENIEQLKNLIEADPNEHALKEIATLFVNAMNDWPTQNQTNINEYIEELYNYFGNPITKDAILSKTTSDSSEDSWRKESAASLLELLDIAEKQNQEEDLEQLIQTIVKYYQNPSAMTDPVTLVEQFGGYDEKMDLSSYQYPTLELLPNLLQSLFSKIGQEASDYKLPLLLDGSEDLKLREIYHHPNILLAGTIAFGKTQFVYNQLVMWLYLYHPAQLKLVICRSKPVDYNTFATLEKHFSAVSPGAKTPLVEGKQACSTIDAIILECEQRLNLFQKAGVKGVEDYNNKFVSRTLDPNLGHRYLPNIVLVMDDIQTFLDENTIKSLIALTQMNLYTGIYLLAVTSQIMSRKITPQLRANFSVRIGMKLMSQNESKKILDRVGAEKLASPGELIYEQGERLVKGTQPYVEYNFIAAICEFISGQRGYPSAYLLPIYEIELPSIGDFDIETRDQLFIEAAQLIVMHQQGSTALIQRKLKLGYNRAGRIIDQLEAAGIVGPFEGSKAREVLYPDEYTLNLYLDSLTKNNYKIDTPSGSSDQDKNFINNPIERKVHGDKNNDTESALPKNINKLITPQKYNSKILLYLVILTIVTAFLYWMSKV